MKPENTDTGVSKQFKAKSCHAMTSLCVSLMSVASLSSMHDKINLWGMKMTITARGWPQAKLRSPELEFGKEHCCIITYIIIRIFYNHLANRIFTLSVFVRKIENHNPSVCYSIYQHKAINFI